MMLRVSILVFPLGILITLKNQNADTKKGLNITRSNPFSDSLDYEPVPSPSREWYKFPFLFMREKVEEGGGSEPHRSMEYDFYRDSCPQAEETIRAIRCDGSILLDDAEGMHSEKKSPPNESLKGFDVVDIIKKGLEELCPGVVSCADILTLAAREGVVLAGGPFYPLYAGRRDSMVAFADMATFELPLPNADLYETLASLTSRGFDLRETVSFLGAHNIGIIHCKFFENRLYNFGRSNEPDPSLDPGFLNLLRSICKNTSSTSPAPSHFFVGSTSSSDAPSSDFNDSQPSSTAASHNFHSSPSSSTDPSPNFGVSPSPSTAQSPKFDASPSSPTGSLHFFEDSIASSAKQPGINVTYDGSRAGFGTVYYRSLLQNKGVLYADQQLMAGLETGVWVKAYASDVSLFCRDFALAMMKLSNLRILTGPMGEIRLNCSKVT